MEELDLSEYDITDVIYELDRLFSKGDVCNGDDDLLIDFAIGLKYKNLMDTLKIKHIMRVINDYTLEQIEERLP